MGSISGLHTFLSLFSRLLRIAVWERAVGVAHMSGLILVSFAHCDKGDCVTGTAAFQPYLEVCLCGGDTTSGWDLKTVYLCMHVEVLALFTHFVLCVFFPQFADLNIIFHFMLA